MNANNPQIKYDVTSRTVTDDGVFPNNAKLPLLFYRPLESFEPRDHSAQAFENLFAQNGWPSAWRGGIFEFHHFHSTAHEVLGCFSGSALLQFGGAANVRIEVQVGDAVIIPAGVAHKCISASQFLCVGAYPAGQSWDTCYGKPGERPATDEAIAGLGHWASNPVGIIE